MKKSFVSRFSIPTFLFALSGVVDPAAAGESADEIAILVEGRQERFEAMGEAMKVYRAYLKGADSVTPDHLVRAAAAIRDNAPDIASYFPEGSGPESGMKTDALPYIWRNTDKFQRLADELPGTAETLVAAVAAGERGVIIGAVRDVAKTCRACHQSFRAD